MAKITGILQFSGKLGQAVGMKGAKGENYARVNVKPANPQTEDQVKQRVKMSLAGQMSKMTAADLIMGLGASKRDRRSAFTANIARNAVNTSDGQGGIMAKINPADVIFSEGIYCPVENVTVTYDGTAVTAAFSGTNLPNDVAGYLVIATIADSQGRVRQIDGDMITDTHRTAVINGAGASANVYYVPVVRNAGADNATYEHAVQRLNADNNYATAAKLSSKGSLSYAASKFDNNYTPGA